MKIRLSENFRALFYSPFYATQATGAFAAAGVEVEMIPSPSPGAAVAVLRAGGVDVMWGGPLRVMLLHDQEPGCDLVCFCDVVARDPFFIVGAKPGPDFKFADLSRLRFATVSEVPTPWICLQNDLRHAGVDPSKVDHIDNQTMAENEAALRAGTLDAIQVFQPYAERLIASGAGHVWNAAATRGLTAYTTLVTRRDVLVDRADELQRMTRAIHRTLQWFAKTPALEIAALLKDYFPDLPTPLYAACIDRYRTLGLWGPDPIIRREGYDRLHAAMRASGALSRDVAFEACVDTALAEKVVRSTKV